jgi:hypothetical protein
MAEREYDADRDYHEQLDVKYDISFYVKKQDIDSMEACGPAGCGVLRTHELEIAGILVTSVSARLLKQDDVSCAASGSLSTVREID